MNFIWGSQGGPAQSIFFMKRGQGEGWDHRGHPAHTAQPGRWVTEPHRAPFESLLHRSQINYATHFRQVAQHLWVFLRFTICNNEMKAHVPFEIPDRKQMAHSSGGNWRKSLSRAIYQGCRQGGVNCREGYSLRAVNNRKLFPPQIYRAKEVTEAKRIIIWKKHGPASDGLQQGLSQPWQAHRGRSCRENIQPHFLPLALRSFIFSSLMGKKKKERKKDNKQTKKNTEMRCGDACWWCPWKQPPRTWEQRGKAEEVDTEEQTRCLHSTKNTQHFGW